MLTSSGRAVSARPCPSPGALEMGDGQQGKALGSFLPLGPGLAGRAWRVSIFCRHRTQQAQLDSSCPACHRETQPGRGAALHPASRWAPPCFPPAPCQSTLPSLETPSPVSQQQQGVDNPGHRDPTAAWTPEGLDPEDWPAGSLGMGVFFSGLQPGCLGTDLSRAGQPRCDGGRAGLCLMVASRLVLGPWGTGLLFMAWLRGWQSCSPFCLLCPGTWPHAGLHHWPILHHLAKTQGPTVATPPPAGREKAHSAGHTPGRPGIGHCLNVPGRTPVCPWAAFPVDRPSRLGNPEPEGLRRKDRVDCSLGHADLCSI
uniref:uncharacterized protein LOC118145567 n=1 Tax=Callithrix jacchus TaxID=9483 RepID=UPI0023DD1B04|nr:uncharacterized protein LOC118145567 [Callithrix jacchus]